VDLLSLLDEIVRALKAPLEEEDREQGWTDDLRREVQEALPPATPPTGTWNPRRHGKRAGVQARFRLRNIEPAFDRPTGGRAGGRAAGRRPAIGHAFPPLLNMLQAKRALAADLPLSAKADTKNKRYRIARGRPLTTGSHAPPRPPAGHATHSRSVGNLRMRLVGRPDDTVTSNSPATQFPAPQIRPPAY
jgi:hypothetical protein